jgi:hypothetical protein
MASQEELQGILETLLGKKHVYYQPPENLTMEYPAIRYSLVDIESIYANNAKYSNRRRYEIIVIDKLPDNEVIQKILALPYSSFDRRYVTNNLNHDVITLYF